MDTKNMQDEDLYELLGINVDCTLQEIKKAYRKKALSCHPDKNPDNPKAAELFHELSRALEILIDESARAAYDKVLRAKKAAKVRHQVLDSKRKKLKEDLEARERKAEEATKKKKNFDFRTDEEKLQAEIERLRKEGTKQLEEEIEYVRRQVELEKQSRVTENVSEEGGNRLTLRWSCKKDDETNGGYDYDILHRMLSKYGDIVALVLLPKKKGRALVEFRTRGAAEMAVEMERGLASNPFTVEWLGVARSNKPSDKGGPRLSDMDQTTPGGLFPSVNREQRRNTGTSFPSFSFDPGMQSSQPDVLNRDLEDMVLRRLRQAEERKRLIEELEVEDS